MKFSRLSLVATLACLGGMPAFAQEYYHSNGRKIPIAIDKSALVVLGNVAAISRDPGVLESTGIVSIEPLAGGGELTILGVPQIQRGAAQAYLRSVELQPDDSVVARPLEEAEPEAESPPMVITREFIVGFNEGISRREVDSLNAARGVQVLRQLDAVDNGYVLLAPTPNDTLRLSNEYFDLPSTRFSHPNFIVERVARAAPNDPLFSRQWHLQNTGQAGGLAGADVDAIRAWTVTQGENILIAVIDPDGVEVEHEDLIGNRFINPGEAGAKANNGIDDDRNGYRDDVSGWNFISNKPSPRTTGYHGTSAAAVAVAACNNNVGVCGVAPKARLLGLASNKSVGADAEAFNYAAKMGADVISNSWGYQMGIPSTDAVVEAIAKAARTGRGGRGTVILFAMTNENIDNFGADGYLDLSAHPDVIAVGRSTNLDRWGHSGFGSRMHLLAPTSAARGTRRSGCDTSQLEGTLEVLTADLMGSVGKNQGGACRCNPGIRDDAALPNYTQCFGGTSSATPLVAGVAALILAANPGLSAREVKDVLADTAVKIDSAAAHYTADGGGRTHSSTHGYGRVNAFAAVTRARQLVAAPPAGPANEAVREVSIPDKGSTSQANVAQNLHALVLDPESAPQVRAALSELNLRSTEVWAQRLAQSDVLVVDEADASNIKDALKKGGAEKNLKSSGRIVFNSANSVSVLLNTAVVRPEGPMPDVARLRSRAKTLGIRTSVRTLFDKTQIDLAAVDPAQDPLEFLASVDVLVAEGLLARRDVTVDWIQPRDVRSGEP